MPIPNKARAVFDQALDLAAPADRAAFLDRACAGDPELRGRVEGLLRAHAEAGSFLEQPPAGPAEADGFAPGAGAVVAGRYKLLEVIGEGGMGTVWLAEQTEPVRRKVALKVIKAGMDSRCVLARFEAERQALALMDHPNIARVLDAGATADGRPFFLMELVKGTPITVYCDDHRLPPRDRLTLFVQACRAVQHAHQKGVIHRDLKPSNVLVAPYDGTPVVKVIDFGVAKAAGQPLTEKTLYTGFGALVGTPEYMSPEQAELNNRDIDTRSDIYSLGALLYELLTGTTPLQTKRVKESALLEVLRLVREEEAPRPSTRLSTLGAAAETVSANRQTEPRRLTAAVRGELDWIVMRALEKDRNRRYESASALAADVERYLADEPVQACPPSATYRLRKFAGRHTGGLAVAVLVLFFLVLLGGGAGWAARDRSAREAEAARQQGDRQAKVAGQVESILAEVDRLQREQKWPEAMSAARRAEAAVAGGEADAATAGRVRDRLTGLEFVNRLEHIRTDRAAVDLEQADRDYAQAFRDYGVDVEELPAEASIERLRARPELAIPIAAALDHWVSVRDRRSGPWTRVVAVARGIDPEPLRDRLRSTWGQPITPEAAAELRRLADSIDLRAHHAVTIHSLANVLRRANHAGTAVRILREARSVYPGDFWLNHELGFALHDHKDPEGAIRFSTAAVSIRPGAAGAHTNLGLALLAHRKADEAIACFRTAVELEPKRVARHLTLGRALRDRPGKRGEAIACFRTAVELDPKRIASHIELGYTLGLDGRLDEAVAAYEEVLRLQPRDAYVHHAYGCFLRDVKRDNAGAVASFQRAIELDPARPLVYSDLGGALLRHGKLDEAIDAFQEATRRDPECAPLHATLGVALGRRGRLGEAADAFREAFRLEPDSATAHHAFGCFLRDGKRDYAGAVASFQRAAELDPNNASIHDSLAWLLATCPDARFRDPGLAVTVAKKAVDRAPVQSFPHYTLGVAHYRAGDPKAAVGALEKSMALSNGGDGRDWVFLAMARWQLGEKDQARELYGRAAQWMSKNRPTDEELRRFRAEAAELFGLNERPDG